jgi:RHS repeat-associated protein
MYLTNYTFFNPKNHLYTNPIKGIRGYGLSYRFHFNGKERDNETYGAGNEYDYGFRIYNPRLCKFLSVDPLTKEYPFYTPYQFAGNTPIMAIDLDGLEVLIKIGSISNGTTQIRLIGSENVNGAPKVVTVPTYPLTITDQATGTTSTYSVTRDALVINATEQPDKNGNLKVTNLTFEPVAGKEEFKGREITDYPHGTDLTAIVLKQNGSQKIPATPNGSPLRDDQNTATDVMIHVGGTYEKSDGSLRITGSLGCFTVVNPNAKGTGNQAMNNLQADIDSRQKALSDKKLSTDINITVEKRKNVTNQGKVQSTEQ